MLAPQLQRLNEGTPWEEVLPDVVEAMVAMHAVAPLLHQSLFEETRLPKIVWEELEAQERALVEVIARALAADPACSAKDPRLAASVVVNVIESLTHRLVLHPPAGSNPAAVSREITSLVRAYLRASSA
jgi:Tetracyclin repressor-like, C-terminal domain